MSAKSKSYSIISSAVAKPARETEWQPATDIYKTRTGWLLKLELAGITLDDIAVAANGSTITVSGVRRDLIREQSCCHHSMEISYSRFKRTIQLPGEIDSSSLEVQYENGILLIRANA